MIHALHKFILAIPIQEQAFLALHAVAACGLTKMTLCSSGSGNEDENLAGNFFQEHRQQTQARKFSSALYWVEDLPTPRSVIWLPTCINLFDFDFDLAFNFNYFRIFRFHLAFARNCLSFCLLRFMSAVFDFFSSYMPVSNYFCCLSIDFAPSRC